MKDLHNYITGKLKLSDVKISSYGGWYDADTFSIKDLKESNILEIDHFRWLVLKLNTALAVLNEVLSMYKVDRFLFVREANTVYSRFTFLPLSDYDKNFPECNTHSRWDIKRINTRHKEYKNKEEIIKDLRNIDKL